MAVLQDGLGVIAVYVRSVWRFRWLALLSATVTCIGLWVFVMLMPNKYDVSTKVYFDTQSILRPLLRGLAIDSSQQQTIELMTRTLLVRPNLEAVARKTDMDLNAQTPKQFEELIDGLVQRIGIRNTRRNNIFVIRYSDSDPKLAYRVVEALLNILVERSLGESRKDSNSTRQFIEEQIKDYESRLVAAETRLKEFKRQNLGLMPTDGGGYYARLEAVRRQVSEAALALEEAERRLASTSEQLKGVPAYFKQAAALGGVDPVVRRIQQAETELDQLLRKFTNKHPDVVAQRAHLDGLNGELQSNRTAAREAPTVGSDGAIDAVPNPLFQELKVAQGEAQSEVAAMKARVAEFQRREEELRRLVDTVPKVEAELSRLNRDYGLDQRNYDELVKRREALKISNDASRTTDDVRFNIIEPPREPLAPSSPNRVLFSAAAFIAALGLGLGLAFVCGLLRPTFYTRQDFSDITRAPVLGVISRVWTPRERLRRRVEVVTFGVGCLTLVLLFGSVLTLHTNFAEEFHQFDLKSKISRLAERLS
jgi:polysaccharide chain length determinant protein (PEP-CTERM system associated)